MQVSSTYFNMGYLFEAYFKTQSQQIDINNMYFNCDVPIKLAPARILLIPVWKVPKSNMGQGTVSCLNVFYSLLVSPGKWRNTVLKEATTASFLLQTDHDHPFISFKTFTVHTTQLNNLQSIKLWSHPFLHLLRVELEVTRTTRPDPEQTCVGAPALPGLRGHSMNQPEHLMQLFDGTLQPWEHQPGSPLSPAQMESYRTGSNW